MTQTFLTAVVANVVDSLVFCCDGETMLYFIQNALDLVEG
jgi:hypothetical protein